MHIWHVAANWFETQAYRSKIQRIVYTHVDLIAMHAGIQLISLQSINTQRQRHSLRRLAIQRPTVKDCTSETSSV